MYSKKDFYCVDSYYAYISIQAKNARKGIYTEIIDEHPISYLGKSGIDKQLFSDLNKRQQEKAAMWVQKHIEPKKSVNWQNSYSLKHILEHDTGVYLTNNQFKDLMLEYGFEPVDTTVQNWVFRIKKVKDERWV